MEIERINENTVKFYISYVDIENRGFEKEDIWYNRERSEQLFWQMMDEINYKEDFSVEGPLWIQVQALEKGLEVLVTKASIANGNISFDSLDELDDTIDITINHEANHMFDDSIENDAHGSFVHDDFQEEEEEMHDYSDSSIWVTTRFNDLEEIIQLSHYFYHEAENELETALYNYKDAYYLYINITADLYESEEEILSQILEYSTEENVTPHMLEEYGKKVIAKNVFEEIRKHFPSK